MDKIYCGRIVKKGKECIIEGTNTWRETEVWLD